MPLIIETLPVGMLEENCHIIADVANHACYIVDPGDDAPKIISAVQQLNLSKETVYKILLTHAHFDHIRAVGEVSKALQAEVYLNEEDHEMYMSPENAYPPFISAAQNLPQPHPFPNDLPFQVIHTPGHTLGGSCFYFPEDKLLITGDTLFYMGIGRSDLPGGNGVQLINSIVNKLMVLPEDTKVLCGHGPSTNVGNEKKHNPYIR